MLNERCFMLETRGAAVAASLPESLALLCDGRPLGFAGLAAHQRHAWFLFLCQTAAMALIRAGKEQAAEDNVAWAKLTDPQAWRQRLAALTPGCADTAWSLVVDNPSRPAFLQPAASNDLHGYNLVASTPDRLDVLITSKNHDIKRERAFIPPDYYWIFSLITLQTLQGYSGRHPPNSFYLGIARMNSGAGSRPMLMLTPGQDLPTRFRRGVQAALAARRVALNSSRGLFRDDGKALLWLEPWDSETSLPLHDLDPLFVEICRRVRLRREPDGGVVALIRPSERPRVHAPKELKGNLGDAWTPVSRVDGTALTVSASGFDYRRLQTLITTDDFNEPEALKTRDDDPPELWLHAAVLVRGQGKTEGFHERWLHVPADMRKPDALPTISKISRAMIVDADAARKALRFGLLAFLQGGPDELDFKDERPRAFLDMLEQRIDDIFFMHLFARFKANLDAATEIAWRKEIRRLARGLFNDALEQLSPPDSRRERARANAEFAFTGLMRKADLVTETNDLGEGAAA